MPTKQRKMESKKPVSIGAKVDKNLHSKVKLVALRKNVSMSTIVEKALSQFVETELNGSE